MIEVSVIWSVYDRRDLVLRALAYLERQTLDPSLWELVFVDDGSPGDYREDLEPWRGKIQLQYVRIDSSQHPVVQSLNPGGKPLVPPYDQPLKFHTPALSHNIGFKLARGKTLLISQPDVLHRESNLENALEATTRKQFLFGKVWMSAPNFRERLLAMSPSALPACEFNEIIQWPGAKAYTFRATEHYWFIAAVSRHAAQLVRGVEEDYLGGVFAEDDQFRERVRLLGWPPYNHFVMEGIHIDHSHLGGRHHRSSPRWLWGANENRSMWRRWMADPLKQAIGNLEREWGNLDYVVTHETWELT